MFACVVLSCLSWYLYISWVLLSDGHKLLHGISSFAANRYDFQFQFWILKHNFPPLHYWECSRDVSSSNKLVGKMPLIMWESTITENLLSYYSCLLLRHLSLSLRERCCYWFMLTLSSVTWNPAWRFQFQMHSPRPIIYFELEKDTLLLKLGFNFPFG